MNFVVIRQRQKGGAAHTVVLKEEKPGSLRCELEVLAVQQVSGFCNSTDSTYLKALSTSST